MPSNLKTSGGHLTNHGKQAVSMAMYVKGKSFLGAAILLRKNGGYEYVVLHLMCQGIEITLKALLLFADYDAYKPRLKKFGRAGHDLLAIAGEVLSAFHLHPMRPKLEEELKQLSILYSKHLLRYGTFYDFLVNPKTIPSDLVIVRVAAALRLIERELSRK